MISSEKFNIMVVDDQQSMRELTCSLLRGIGYRSLWAAESGTQAMAQLEKTKLHLVLLDVEMPGMNGLETLKAIRGNDKHASLDVIMVTGRADPTLVEQAGALKVSGYLLKPISPSSLGGRVDGVRRRIA